MPVATVTTSAAGSLALLEDEDKDVRSYALQHLLAIVPQFWAEISDVLPLLEDMADPLTIRLPSEYRPYAALLASKTYFYIGVLAEAVEFALKAGAAFEKEPAGEYKETIIAGCIDRAIALTSTSPEQKLDPNLQAIVDGVLRSNSGDNGKLAIGLALSLRRLDLIEMLFLTSRSLPQASSSSAPATSRPEHDESLLRYILAEVVGGTSGNEDWPPEFREKLFELLLRLFMLNPSPDWNSITTVWIQSSDSRSCGKALVKLMDEKSVLEAFQIAFDVSEVATQQFVEHVQHELYHGEHGPDPNTRPPLSPAVLYGDEDPNKMLDEILTGETSAELFLNFLSKNNKTDMSILKVTKESLEDRYSIYHSAITFTNAFANCGTTSDRFLRENLDWLGRANNWAKFSATAALGLIHRGSWKNGIRVVKPYLPGGSSPSKFSEGGALFALGLICAGRKEGAEGELRKALAEGNDPTVQHGAALGLGVSALATADEGIYEEIRTALFQDNATAGEASGYAMGLVMLGTASEKALEEMTSYARETQHEKIIRSLAVGVAFVMYAQRERADEVIKTLTEDKDAIMRYGGMFTIALAYAGTGSNKAVRKLLHVAVSDVSDDVRRAAVTALGFVLFRNHTQVPRIVQLLAESYNPHVRHGATFALGISCAGTGLEAAIDLLEPMTRDPVDFVRQGAYISLALVLIQQTEAQCPKSAAIRERFSKVVADKHEDPIARFGASLAQGIIDAGGRNMTLSLSTRAGTLNTSAIVGVALFVQFWYWFPLAHGLGLAFSPTAIIGLDAALRIPKIDMTCHARPSMFAYPNTQKVKKEEEKKKAKTAVLSTTAKAKARAKSKKAADGDVEMDETPSADGTPSTSATKKAPKVSEPSSFKLGNMTRVTPLQAPLVSFPADGRYTPIRPIRDGGAQASAGQSKKGASLAPVAPSTKVLGGSSVVLLRDSRPEEEGEYIELDEALWPCDEPSRDTRDEEMEPSTGDEAEMPAPFEYPFEDA